MPVAPMVTDGATKLMVCVTVGGTVFQAGTTTASNVKDVKHGWNELEIQDGNNASKISGSVHIPDVHPA